MKKNLLKLNPESLRVIASQISIEYTTHKETAERVAEYYRDYGLRWSDLVARYHIEGDHITHN